MAPSASSWLRYTLLVLVIGLMCIYWGLSVKPIYKTQELRVAETARVMVADGDWLVPRYNGEVRLRKPPLAYWLTASSYEAFGKVTEFTARFASATFSLFSVLALFLWLRKASGTATALATIICFVSSYMALRYFRSAETDAILLFFVIAACIVVYRLLFEGVSTSRVVALHVLMGLGFLTKGPAALAMPLAVLLFFSLKRRQYALLRKLVNPLGLLLLLLLALGWYAAIYFELHDVATYWVGEEVEATYLGGHRANPVYWYVPGLFKFFAPWSVFFIPAGIWLYRTRPLPPVVQLALVWFAATFIILSLNITKQIQYALLLSPSLAILLGHYLANARGRYERLNNILYAGLILGAIGTAIWLIVKGEGGVNAQVLLLAMGGLTPVAVGALLRVNLRRHAPALLLVGLIASVWVYGQERLYADSEESNVKHFALAAKSYDPLYVYGGPNARISFYAQRVVPNAKDGPALERLTGPHEVFYLATESESDVPPACRNAAPVMRDGQYVLLRCRLGDKNLAETGEIK